MPNFSRDFEKTLQRALSVAGMKGRIRDCPLHLAAAEVPGVAKLAREHQHPLHCILEQQEV